MGEFLMQKKAKINEEIVSGRSTLQRIQEINAQTFLFVTTHNVAQITSRPNKAWVKISKPCLG